MTRARISTRGLAAAACLAGLAGIGRSGAAPLEPLALREPSVAKLQPGQSARRELSLAQRDCAFLELRGPGRVLQAELRDPAGRRVLRRFESRRGGPLALDVCVEPAGRYAIAYRADTPGEYAIELQQILGRPSAAPPTAAGPAVTSPRLARLQNELTQPAALDRFWREVERAGTPLVEPGDADNLLATFLYRAGPATGRVAVSWPMWTGAFAQPDLVRLPGSDVLWKSVKLPRAARLSYQLAIDVPRDPSPGHDFAERAERAVSRSDPRNPHLLWPAPEADAFHQRSILTLPDAAPERWLEMPSGPPGRLTREPFASALLENTHELSVYLPAGYTPQSALPLLIFFDGEQYVDELHTPELLDRLVAARAIAPLIAVFVHNATPSSREQELPCNPRFARFVVEELLPHVWGQYAVSRDPREVGLAGSSFGGLAASYLALEHPGLFGKVLSQSGSFWWSFPRGHAQFDGSAQPGWLRRRFQQRPRAAIELYLSAGTLETDAADGGVLEQNRLQRDALRALGYAVAYQELAAGHDPLAWRAALPNGLITLFPPRR